MEIEQSTLGNEMKGSVRNSNHLNKSGGHNGRIIVNTNNEDEDNKVKTVNSANVTSCIHFLCVLKQVALFILNENIRCDCILVKLGLSADFSCIYCFARVCFLSNRFGWF